LPVLGAGESGGLAGQEPKAAAASRKLTWERTPKEPDLPVFRCGLHLPRKQKLANLGATGMDSTDLAAVAVSRFTLD
jgi:hypothetical protein